MLLSQRLNLTGIIIPQRNAKQGPDVKAILHGMKSGATKPVNYNKVKGVIRKQRRTLWPFMIG
jgi:hypothetical protein